MSSDRKQLDLFRTVLAPVASPEDARETARAIRAYLPSDAIVHVAHVVEKGVGVPDKASVEQREAYAEAAYEAFLEPLRDTALVVTPQTLYGRNVAETILNEAREVGATALVFTPRSANRWLRLLSGDVTDSLVHDAHVPVVVLPRLQDRIVLD